MALSSSQGKEVPVEGIEEIVCLELTHAQLIFIHEAIEYYAQDAEKALEHEYHNLSMDQRLLLKLRLFLKAPLLEKLEKEERALFTKNTARNET